MNGNIFSQMLVLCIFHNFSYKCGMIFQNIPYNIKFIFLFTKKNQTVFILQKYSKNK